MSMYVELVREYRFEAAHFLPKVPEGHRCRRLHGHSFKIDVVVGGEASEETGFLIDFYDLDRVVQPVIDALDHRLLNEITGLDNPTSERIGRYLYDRLAPDLAGLYSVTVWETVDSRSIYYGPRGPARRI
jgi:6-pyruvoyltetrahydropterin/6-carboxytetrahydropterin synthase